MCTVSMVGDHYSETFPQRYEWMKVTPIELPTEVSREEFERLKADVEDMKSLLERAKEYDERTGQPNCEMEEKMRLLREIAKAVGVEL